MTTAASLFFSVGVGAAMALSQLGLAVGLTVLALLTLRALNYFESRLEGRLTRDDGSKEAS